VPDVQRRKAQRKALLIVAVAVFLAAVIGPVAGLFIARRSGEEVTGRVGADRTPVGTFSFAVTECASGHAFVPGFFGADLRGGNGYHLRVADTGDDAQLWLYPRGGRTGAIELRKRDCSEWDVLIEWAHVTVNRVHTVSGHVQVACAVGGGKVTAHASFQRCAL
jgi:hypothetical protein